MAKTTAKKIVATTAKKKPLTVKKKVTGKPASVNAAEFMKRLIRLKSPVELKKHHRYFTFDENDKTNIFIGVRMGHIFELAKEFIEMPPVEIEKLLESRIHEIRAGAVSIMDKQARNKKTPQARRKELFDLYIKRHDRINNWDLVDLGCLHMTGSYLFDKPRDILYKLARSKNMWERRSAMVSTTYFLRQGESTDAFKIAALLLNDKEDLVHKAIGWMLRLAGDKDRPKLLRFLDKNAATMPRVALRYTIEHLDKKQREHYMNMKNANR